MLVKDPTEMDSIKLNHTRILAKWSTDQSQLIYVNAVLTKSNSCYCLDAGILDFIHFNPIDRWPKIDRQPRKATPDLTETFHYLRLRQMVLNCSMRWVIRIQSVVSGKDLTELWTWSEIGGSIRSIEDSVQANRLLPVWTSLKSQSATGRITTSSQVNCGNTIHSTSPNIQMRHFIVFRIIQRPS